MNKVLQIKHSFNFLNTLYSIYQGKFVYLNILKNENSKLHNKEIPKVKETIEYCGEWIKKLWKEEYLLEDHDQKCKVIKIMKLEYKRYAKFLKTLDKLIAKRKHQKSDYFVLLAILGRHAYTRESYINGLIAYGENRNLKDLSDQYRQHLLSAKTEVLNVNAWVNKWINHKNVTGMSDIPDLCKHLPGLFKEQQQGINQLLDLYIQDGGFL